MHLQVTLSAMEVQQQFFEQLLIYLGISLILVPIALKLKLGSIIGYLLAGVLIGPSALHLVKDSQEVFHFAEFGVVILLFLIGLELQPRKLWAMRGPILKLGLSQVLIGSLALGLAVQVFTFKTMNFSLSQSLVIGFALAMSSTAFAIQLMKDFSESNTEQGRSAFSVLLFQDISVIPVLALIPLLFATGLEDQMFNPTKFFGSLLAIAGIIFVGRYLVRYVFRIVAGTHVRELFTGLALFVVIGTASIMHLVGLSMALGTFIAGVLLAESEYRHEIEADLDPFKGLLLGLFFISVGMSLDLNLLVEKPVFIAVLVLGLIGLKFGLHYAIARANKMSHGTALKFALLLAQGGEFAFVLFGVATSQKLFTSEQLAPFTVAVTLSMALSPILYGQLTNWMTRQTREEEQEKNYDSISDQHPIIIAGFGRFGQIIARVLRMKGMPFTALENDSENVEGIRRFGNKIFYGDASRVDLLEAAGASKARLFVLAINNVETSLRVAAIVRQHYPNLTILARARNRQHLFELRDLGVQHIVRDTFYSSLFAAKSALMFLGDSELSADIACNYFKQNDEQLMNEQYKNHKDEEHVIAASRLSANQLIEAFARDQKE
jgi:monovalent cation:proton antiporter-2 (CPA2) family protein